MLFNRKLSAMWLANLSVATMAIGLFQEVSSKLPIIGQVPQWAVLATGIFEFLLANYLSNLDEKEGKK